MVFIHGLWLLASSWDRWAKLFAEAGYAPVTAGWPDDPEAVAQAAANLNPWSETKVDTANPERGPLLIISGEKDNTVPRAITEAVYRKRRRNPDITEYLEMPNRGHALTIDNGWREVAETSLKFIGRFA